MGFYCGILGLPEPPGFFFGHPTPPHLPWCTERESNENWIFISAALLERSLVINTQIMPRGGASSHLGSTFIRPVKSSRVSFFFSFLDAFFTLNHYFIIFPFSLSLSVCVCVIIIPHYRHCINPDRFQSGGNNRNWAFKQKQQHKCAENKY